MTSPLRNWIRSDREGQTLAIVAVSMVALLAMMSLGIDLGMAYTARAEAQRVADSAALAGASIFMEHPGPADSVAAATARAREYAGRNVVRNRPVDPAADVQVQVRLDSAKVRVWVERTGLPTWFARLIGIDQLSVRAMAAAQAVPGGSTNCLMPWAVVDGFLRTDGSVPDEDEAYHPDLHDYEPARSRCSIGETGYGASTPRNSDCDFGLEFTIKSNNPRDPVVPKPGIFMPIELKPSEDQGTCAGGGGPYQRNICACNSTPISIGDTLRNEPGNMSGPTIKGVEELYNKDPLATWGTNGIVGGAGGASPRIVKMILISPDQIQKGGRDDWVVQNFGQFFIEEFHEEGQGQDKIAHVRGRFMYYISGTGGGHGEATSPLVKFLRLVE
jgi:hypothetical protein